MTNPTGAPNRVRTSDSEREQVVTVLRQAIVEGRLTLAEGEERIASAYESKFRDELYPLTNDLPGGARDPLGDSLRDQIRGSRHEWHGRRRRGFFCVPFLALLAFVIIAGFGGGFHFFWLIPLVFLTLFVARRIFFWRAWSGGRGPWR
jgi:hypothetical protein